MLQKKRKRFKIRSNGMLQKERNAQTIEKIQNKRNLENGMLVKQSRFENGTRKTEDFPNKPEDYSDRSLKISR